MYMIITDLFDIDIHIFTVIKFLFNLVVKFKYIYILLTHKLNEIFLWYIYVEETTNQMMMTTTTTVMNTSPWEGKSIGSNDIYYMNIIPKGHCQ